MRLRDAGNWMEADITSLVQAWVSGSASNEGILLIGRGINREVIFRASDYVQKTLRPKLMVQFYPAPPTPTPTNTATPTSTPTTTPQPGGIQGRVWNDLDGDGVMGTEEPGLAGATVLLYDYAHPAPEPPIRPAFTTGADGTFQFADLLPGWYILIETNPAGYESTTSDTLNVLVSSGVTAQVNFGDWIPTSQTPTPTGTILRPYRMFMTIIRKG